MRDESALFESARSHVPPLDAELLLLSKRQAGASRAGTKSRRTMETKKQDPFGDSRWVGGLKMREEIQQQEPKP